MMRYKTAALILAAITAAGAFVSCGRKNTEIKVVNEPETSTAAAGNTETEKPDTEKTYTEKYTETEKEPETEKTEKTEKPEEKDEPEEEKTEVPTVKDEPEDKDDKDSKDGKDDKGTERTASGGADGAVELAKDLIGTQYKMGGTGPDEFDNSGFVYYVYKENGIKVPRFASEMESAGKKVSRDDLEPGDILVFSNEIGGSAEYVGIYAGDGKFIACSNPDSPTEMKSISGYWEARFICGRRVG